MRETHVLFRFPYFYTFSLCPCVTQTLEAIIIIKYLISYIKNVKIIVPLSPRLCQVHRWWWKPAEFRTAGRSWGPSCSLVSAEPTAVSTYQNKFEISDQWYQQSRIGIPYPVGLKTIPTGFCIRTLFIGAVLLRPQTVHFRKKSLLTF